MNKQLEFQISLSYILTPEDLQGKQGYEAADFAKSLGARAAFALVRAITVERAGTAGGEFEIDVPGVRIAVREANSGNEFVTNSKLSVAPVKGKKVKIQEKKAKAGKPSAGFLEALLAGEEEEEEA